MSFAEIISAIDDFVWGPVMLILLVGTGVFLTVRLKFRPWRNLGYALKSTLSKEARTTSREKVMYHHFQHLLQPWRQPLEQET